MKYLIMTNGSYGSGEWYRSRNQGFDRVICADGGAGMALKLGIKPDLLVGDMDSISASDLMELQETGTRIERFSVTKDDSDTYLALEMAVAQGADEVVIWGGSGTRLDHTLANLYSAGHFAQRGLKVSLESPQLVIYLVTDRLVLQGTPGDTVSVLVLGDRASGVTLRGFQYQLDKVTLEGMRQIGISNVLTAPESLVEVECGLLAVFHNLMLLY